MNKNITLLGLSLALLAAAIVSLTILSPYLALLLVVGAGLVCYFPARRSSSAAVPAPCGLPSHSGSPPFWRFCCS